MWSIIYRKHGNSAPKPHSVDLICFPEMIFTGYVFPDAPSILAYLEEPRNGPTSMFCSELASRLKCYVVAGYPERLAPDEVERGVRVEVENDSALSDCEEAYDDVKEIEIDRVGANSVVLCGPDGECVGGYRKTNLFRTDMTWAKPGTGFATFRLPPPIGRLTIGVCMDLNPLPPANWRLEEGSYELADHAIKTDSDTVVLLNAWLASREGEEEEETSEDWRVVQYWAARLRPLWAKKEGQEGGKEVLVAVCNRCGEENGITFAGSSATFSMNRSLGRPRLLHVMARREEGAQVWSV